MKNISKENNLFERVPESVRKLHEQGKRERRLRARKAWKEKYGRGNEQGGH
jgi:hypothetical protein